tara:strand:- start:979 stop:2187 length:1209 start_codon:yes stop_codon:yes gene_type:complete
MNNSQSKQLHINISGDDYPGILANVIVLAVRFGWDIIDIKQFVFNGLLNLSMLMEGGGSVDSLRTELNEYGRKTGLNIGLQSWDVGRLLDSPYHHKFVVTILGKRIDSEALLEFTKTIAENDTNILRIEQLDYGDYHVLEILLGLKKSASGAKLFEQLLRVKENQSVDIAVQEDTLFRRNKRLIVMDADMTFLQCEVIDELGKLAQKEKAMKAITSRTMNGEMDFTEALRQRVALLKGLPVSKLYELLPRIPMTPGAEGLVRILKHLGYKIAIVSGGFQFFIDKLKEKYGLDYGFANSLKIEKEILTGEIEGDIVDAQTKEKLLVSLAEKEGISLKQVVAVGDGANDIYMLAAAGLGIAFNAKPIVQQHVQASINISNLELILYFLGISGKELKELRRVTQP